MDVNVTDVDREVSVRRPQLVHLYAERGSPKFEKAALRWLERYLTEGSPRLRHFAEVVASLAGATPMGRTSGASRRRVRVVLVRGHAPRSPRRFARARLASVVSSFVPRLPEFASYLRIEERELEA